MTGHDDTPQAFDDLDRLFDELLAGDEPTAAMPAWSADVALLVRVAQAPARPDELAAEQDVVRRMSEVRRSVLAHDAAGGADDRRLPATGPSGPTTVIDLGDRRAGRAGDRGYRAKHAAARLERSRHPAVRTLGRAVAMKAAAITTAAAIGAAAAAAATTGIVASVVVPALSDEPDEPAPTPVTIAIPDQPSGDPSADGTEDADRPTRREQSVQPGCPLLPAACAQDPLPAQSPTTVPPAAPPASAPTTVPADAADEPAPTSTPGSPATTEIPETPVTTEPPPTTTVPEDPPSDPPPGTFSLPEQAEGTGRGKP